MQAIVVFLAVHFLVSFADADYKFRCIAQFGCEVIPCGAVPERRNDDVDVYHLDCQPQVSPNTISPAIEIGGRHHAYQCKPINGCTFEGCVAEPDFVNIPWSVVDSEKNEYYISCKSSQVENGSVGEEFRCKPRPECDLSYCDPLSPALIEIEGFDPDSYRKSDEYHIKCEPWSNHPDKNTQGDQRDLKEMLADITKNMSNIVRMVDTNKEKIFELETRMSKELQELEEIRGKMDTQYIATELETFRKEMDDTCTTKIKEMSAKYDLEMKKLKASVGYSYPRSCIDAKNTVKTSGPAIIFPMQLTSNGIHVYCDQDTDGGGWIVIQKRMGGPEDFFRGWEDYVRGFGGKESDFWLGLEIIHLLTSSAAYELRVDLEDSSGNRAYAKYSTFWLAAARTSYRITVSGYSGNAGDSLTYHNQQSFSTKDHGKTDCATYHTGAWWYKGCHRSNLNGVYNGAAANARGVSWFYWKNTHESLKRAEMKIRIKN